MIPKLMVKLAAVAAIIVGCSPSVSAQSFTVPNTGTLTIGNGTSIQANPGTIVNVGAAGGISIVSPGNVTISGPTGTLTGSGVVNLPGVNAGGNLQAGSFSGGSIFVSSTAVMSRPSNVTLTTGNFPLPQARGATAQPQTAFTLPTLPISSSMSPTSAEVQAATSRFQNTFALPSTISNLFNSSTILPTDVTAMPASIRKQKRPPVQASAGIISLTQLKAQPHPILDVDH
jgi:hypothetical protein